MQGWYLSRGGRNSAFFSTFTYEFFCCVAWLFSGLISSFSTFHLGSLNLSLSVLPISSIDSLFCSVSLYEYLSLLIRGGQRLGNFRSKFFSLDSRSSFLSNFRDFGFPRLPIEFFQWVAGRENRKRISSLARHFFRISIFQASVYTGKSLDPKWKSGRCR